MPPLFPAHRRPLAGASPTSVPARTQHFRSGAGVLTLFLLIVLGLALVGLLLAISLALGSRALPLPDVIRALVSPDDSVASVIVWELRLPRALAALLVGSGLAVAGVLMQSLTRNPPGGAGSARGQRRGRPGGGGWSCRPRHRLSQR